MLTTIDARGVVGQSETIAGLVVGVEKQRQPVGKDQIVEVAQLNILTKEGLRGVPLAQIQRVRFMKQTLDQEFRKALEVLAMGHDKSKKTVSLNFSGEGKRSVKVGYVTESPIWKTSYRLSLADKKNAKVANKENGERRGKSDVEGAGRPAGLGNRENTSDEDWAACNLGWCRAG